MVSVTEGTTRNILKDSGDWAPMRTVSDPFVTERRKQNEGRRLGRG